MPFLLQFLLLFHSFDVASDNFTNVITGSATFTVNTAAAAPDLLISVLIETVSKRFFFFYCC